MLRDKLKVLFYQDQNELSYIRRKYMPNPFYQELITHSTPSFVVIKFVNKLKDHIGYKREKNRFDSAQLNNQISWMHPYTFKSEIPKIPH